MTHRHGFSLIELLVVLAIVSVLATIGLPLAELAHRRTQEEALRQGLRDIRRALDDYKTAVDEGRIVRIEGLDELRAFCGRDLVLEHLLPIGQPRRNWKATLLSDGYVLMRHPSHERCMEMMSLAVNRLRMHAR